MAGEDNLKPPEGLTDQDFAASFRAIHDRDRFRKDSQAYRDYVGRVIAEYATGQAVWMVSLAKEPTTYTLFFDFGIVGRIEDAGEGAGDLYLEAQSDGQVPVGRVQLGVGARALSAFAEIEKITESLEAQ